MNEDKIKVIYIAGASRSGSTFLSNILGEIDGVFNAGELIDIWDRGIAWNGRCSCGIQINKCEVWSAVLDKAFNGASQVNVEEMINLRDSAAHSRNIPWRMFIPGAKSKLESHLDKYLSNLEKLYQAIQSIKHCRIIIDSSKNAGYAYILSMISRVDLYIVHLIRDPRATAYSWLCKKEGLWQARPVKTTLEWNVRNIATKMLRSNAPRKYLRVYYEDFVNKPRETIKNILDLVQDIPENLPFITERKVELGINHSIYGNPNRFQTGVIKIQLDNKWKNMKRLDKAIVTTLTWPLLIGYRYPIFHQSR
jgi:hypothetical protein